MPHLRAFATFRSTGGDLVALVSHHRNVAQRQLAAAAYVTTRRPFALRIKHATWLALRWSGRLVWLAPALWLASVVAPPPIPAYLVVAFVGTVVLFFAMVNLFVIASFAIWRARVRPELELVPPHRRALPAPAAALPPPGQHEAPLDLGSLVTVEGRIVPLGQPADETAPVLVDVWSSEGSPLRLTQAYPFAICADGQLPVIFAPAEAPLVHGDHERRSLPELLPGLDPETRWLYDRVPRDADARDDVEVVTLRPGDRVRVVAPVVAVVEDVTRFALGDEELGLAAGRDGTPYREGERQRGIMVAASGEQAALVYAE